VQRRVGIFSIPVCKAKPLVTGDVVGGVVDSNVQVFYYAPVFSAGILRITIAMVWWSGRELDDEEMHVTRIKPEGLDVLCRDTKFTRKELQIMYRGFKQVRDESEMGMGCVHPWVGSIQPWAGSIHGLGPSTGWIGLNFVASVVNLGWAQ